MKGTAAIVVTEEELTNMLTQAGKAGAREVMSEYEQQLEQDPVERHTQLLRDFIEDRSILDNPREVFGSGRHIRRIIPAKNGKPKSVAWFQGFKRESKLNLCKNRPSPDHGRLQEWCFEDIANAWDNYNRQRWMRAA